MAGRRRQVVERALRRGGEAELLALGVRFRESFLEVDTFRRPCLPVSETQSCLQLMEHAVGQQGPEAIRTQGPMRKACEHHAEF